MQELRLVRISDLITFIIGIILRMGLLEPLRNRMNLRSERVPFCEDDIDDVEVDLEMELIPDEFCKKRNPHSKKTRQNSMKA